MGSGNATDCAGWVHEQLLLRSVGFPTGVAGSKFMDSDPTIARVDRFDGGQHPHPPLTQVKTPPQPIESNKSSA